MYPWLRNGGLDRHRGSVGIKGSTNFKAPGIKKLEKAKNQKF